MNLLSLIILIAAIVTIIGTVSIVDLFIDTWERELKNFGSFIKAVIAFRHIKEAYLYVYDYIGYLAYNEHFDTDELYDDDSYNCIINDLCGTSDDEGFVAFPDETSHN